LLALRKYRTVMAQTDITIDRHKTAIRRAGFSLPVNCLLRDALIGQDMTFFDYGCGLGQDLELLSEKEITCIGWDPVHRPKTSHTPADVVNLGYVINVIENQAERAEALRAAWSLANTLLVVSAQLDNDASGRNQASYADGYLTLRNTFQRYFTQSELRAYIDDTLGAESIPAAPGVFYVFKNEERKQRYLVGRFRRKAAIPQQRISEILFEQSRDILDPLMEALTQLGRVPEPDEFSLTPQIVERLGSVKRAFAIVRRVTDEAPWEEIAAKRREDLLVYLALSRFGRRPPFAKLPISTQRDIKAFLGSYARACKLADALLFSVADATLIDQACRGATIGQLVDNGLLVHRDALDSLEPLLRTYEGCARALIGEIDAADVIKLHRFSGKVSYLLYRDYETEEKPALRARIKVCLRDLSIGFFEYGDRIEEARLETKVGLG